MENNKKKLLKVRDVARVLRTSKMSIYRLIKAKELKAVKLLKKSYRIKEKDLDDFIKAHMINEND